MSDRATHPPCPARGISFAPGPPTIQALWIGDRLSTLERLSLRSFMAHGHHVRLYCYGRPAGVPEGVETADAGAILPWTVADGCLRGGVPVAYVSDWFRHALLAAEGGIWVDTDVVCLKRFVFDGPVVAGWEDEAFLATCVLGFPAGHEAARALAAAAAAPWRRAPWDDARARLRTAMRRVRYAGRPAAFRRSLPWGGMGGPATVTRAWAHYGLLGLALPASAFCPVHYTRFLDLVRSDGPPELTSLSGSYAIHLWGALWDMHGVGRDVVRAPGCLLEQLKEAYL